MLQRMKNVKMIHNDDDIFMIQFFFACGSINEHIGIQGISHFLEHIKFNKSKSYSNLELKEKLTELGGTFNAYTSYDHTSYFVKTNVEQYDKCIDLTFELVFNTQFSDNNLETERSVIMEERETTRANTHMMDTMMNIMLKSGNPYCRKIIGTKTDILKITNMDLKRYNDEHYVWDNVRIIVSCPKRLRAIVHKKIASKAKGLIQQPGQSISNNAAPTTTSMPNKWCVNYDKFDYKLEVTSSASSVTKVIMIFKSWAVRSIEQYLLNFVSYIVSNSFESLLFKELREKHGMVYAVKMNSICLINIGFSYITFSTTHKKYETVVEKVLFILRNQLIDGKIGKKQFEKMRKSYLRTLTYMFSHTMTVLEYYCSIIYDDRVFEKDFDLEWLMERIRNLDFEEFTCLCRRLFDFDQVGMYINTRTTNIGEEIKKIKSLLENVKQPN